jgi:hypothetical protein
MATTSIDVYAATNPAFCSLVLRSFVAGYAESDASGSPLPLIILPLPIVLTEEISLALMGTNVKTGLLPWAVRSQEAILGLADRVADAASFSREALLFGIRYRIVSITSDGRLHPDARGLAKQPDFPVATDLGRALSLARRLGLWMGQIRDIDTIFISLGIDR